MKAGKRDELSCVLSPIMSEEVQNPAVRILAIEPDIFFSPSASVTFFDTCSQKKRTSFSSPLRSCSFHVYTELLI